MYLLLNQNSLLCGSSSFSTHSEIKKKKKKKKKKKHSSNGIPDNKDKMKMKNEKKLLDKHKKQQHTHIFTSCTKHLQSFKTIGAKVFEAQFHKLPTTKCYRISGPSCSKLTKSLVNDSLKFS